ncbi:isopentenyl-diphosphate Delta-isomerase [Muricauda sp. JGD-17]|uniref:Isopentenyl-diphosphate delta-isomerase n=1 Tax=Flagellimonas ochracea TaxID=2696472 RepID=A0A964TFF2_9FLAO|nr:isopentenyl-diphosphate Delta-isomerase [Allomuricauda ochracea]NAY93258.1 isopentenyl-diphosphate Delta-isomerase [Allomuricauda ochracea]
MKEENVILVNEADEPIGLMPKMEAHEKAVLHRAFSVFIMNEKGETMLQQRAASKYHSPMLWTNTCCSHQREGESNLEAGKRRLKEEMGFTTELKQLFSFIYKAPFDNGLTEHELDHVMMGVYNGTPNLNPNEVADWKWMALEDIKEDISNNPDCYTAWFKIIFEKFYDYLTLKPDGNES